MIEVLILFQTIIILFLGCVLCFLAYKLIKPNAEIKLPFSKEEGDIITRQNRVPIDQFLPRKDVPVKIEYSQKDDITKVIK